MSHRFFIPPEWITPPTVQLSDDTARQIRTVLRMQAGDELTVLDNSGRAWRVTLTEVGRKQVTGQIAEQFQPQTEPAVAVTLYQGTLKSSKFEWVLQKGTELGVTEFVPTICRRSVVRDTAALNKKMGRWQQIIREAAEQSGRAKLPILAPPLPLESALRQLPSATLAIAPWEEASELTLKAVLQPTVSKLALFIGPEGGFDSAEATQFEAAGAKLVTLGPRILRAETAALAACAAIFYQLD